MHIDHLYGLMMGHKNSYRCILWKTWPKFRDFAYFI